MPFPKRAITTGITFSRPSTGGKRRRRLIPFGAPASWAHAAHERDEAVAVISLQRLATLRSGNAAGEPLSGRVQKGLRAGCARQTQHVIDASLCFAPAHQLLSREGRIPTHDDSDLWQASADRGHDRFERPAIFWPVPVANSVLDKRCNARLAEACVQGVRFLLLPGVNEIPPNFLLLPEGSWVKIPHDCGRATHAGSLGEENHRS